jgi:1A family penicillin-binding protein
VKKDYLGRPVDNSKSWAKRVLRRLKGGNKRQKILKDIFLVFGIFAVLFCTVVLLWVATLKTPSLDSFDARLLGQSAKIYDRTGSVLLYDLSQKVRRTVVPYDNISPYIKKATISIEDADFYSHGGIKPKSILRAILANAMSLRFSQGGSTITQQVVKNSLLTNEKFISRKIKEWILAIKLEQKATKDEILNLYLNESPYGGNMYGVEEATQAFFNKKSSDVTLAEAAYIAALPQSPSTLSPYGKNKDRLDNRKNLVLLKMLENKHISQEEYELAKKEEVKFAPRSVTGIKAPHFVMYTKDYLEEKYGERLLSEGGLKIISTIDYDLQQMTEETVKEYILNTGIKTYKATNGAVVITDPKTGQILTMVGSRDYFDKEIGGNFNVTTARRQPGSAFKPFVYLTAFTKGFTQETPLFDVPTEFNSSCSPAGTQNTPNATCYSPENYEGGYKGLMSIRKSLAESRNIPAVKLLYLVGVDNVIKMASNLGVSGLAGADQYGLSLALGGGEVSLLDMTAAYGVFAQNGQKHPLVGIIKIEKADGEVLEEYQPSPKQVVDNQAVRQLNDVLSDRYARAPIFGANYFGTRDVGIKSGTTNSSRDAWMIGYTPSISVGAWMGNNDNTPMTQQASARIIGPMWKKIMDYALEKVPVEEFETPDSVEPNLKSYLRGIWQTEGGEVHSELYWVDRSNIKGPVPGLGSNDPLFRNFEAGINSYNGSFPISNLNNTPTQSTPDASNLKILTPSPNSAVGTQDRVYITVGGTKDSTTQVQYFINNTLIGSSNQPPYSFSFIPGQTIGIEDENEIKAVFMDNIGKSITATTFFSIIR